MDSYRLGEWQEPPAQLKPKKRKLGLLQRKTKEIEKRLAELEIRAEAFRQKIAKGEAPEIVLHEGN